MVRVERERARDGAGNAVLDLQVSTVGELPAIGAEIGYRMKVSAGSVSQVIQSGVFYTLDDNGTWYDEAGNAAN